MSETIQQSPNTRQYTEQFVAQDYPAGIPKCPKCAFNRDSFRCADSPCSPMAQHGDLGRLDQRNVIWVAQA